MMFGPYLIVSSLIGLFVSLAVLMVLGVYVVKAYPNPKDPARNARRFIIPAVVLVLMAGLALICILVGIVFAILGL